MKMLKHALIKTMVDGLIVVSGNLFIYCILKRFGS